MSKGVYPVFGEIEIAGSQVVLDVKIKGNVRQPFFINSDLLLAGEVYISPTFDLLEYKEITGVVFADTDGVLYVESSHDGLDWIRVFQISVTGNTAEGFKTPLYEQFVRLVYENGATNQTTFKLRAFANN